jgi:hypothetical protein
MIFLNILLGIGLFACGIWLIVYAVKQFQKGTSDSLGWRGNYLILGIALIICGIIEICRQF